ncbi:MAG TPA: TonB-dependent siderophore receptor [Steroidobacteraceae bacterium]|nr:TonB-dependent siderophore receptor [Steroidobacteraceae bacterium]
MSPCYHSTSTRYRIRAMLLALAFGAGVSGAALAEGPNKDEAEELGQIIVSAPHYVPSTNSAATKLDIPLIETPQAITVVSRDQIDLLNMQNLGQAVRYTSGVIGENFGADERYDWLTLRGFNPIEYIDGLQAPYGSVSNIGLDLYGSESVEVLKGPSAVLYGSTPPGGIVNLTSRRPSDEFGGELGLQYGEYDNKQAQGDITGPLGEHFSYRLTALYRDRGTQMDHVDSGRFYVAPALTWRITDAARLTLLSYYQDDQVDGDGGGFLPSQGVVTPNPNGELHANVNGGEPDYNTYRRHQYGVGYDFRYDFTDALNLQQNLKYSSADARMLTVYGAGLQADLRTLNRFNFPFNESVGSFAIDTRMTAHLDSGSVEHTLLFGVDWRRYTNESEFAFGLGPTLDIFAPVYGTPVTTPAPFFPYISQSQKQTGIYAQEQMKVNHWVVTLSARNDELKAENFGTARDDSEFTYRGGVNYVFDSGWAPYIAYAKSFQPTYGAAFDGTPFVPTSGKQIEGGLKFEARNTPKDVRAFGSIAIYQLKQENVLTPDPDPTHLFFNVQTGEVEVKGIEVEGVARFHERLSLNASYSYTDSEVTKSNGADLGKRLTMVPENKFSLLADYTFQDGPMGGFGFSGGVRYMSDSFGTTNNDPTLRTPSVTLFDMVLHYDRAHWHAALNGSNIFDKEYLSRCSSVDQCFFGLRRNVVFTVERKF